MAGTGMADNSGRFVGRQDILILIEDPQRMILLQPAGWSSPDLLQTPVPGSLIAGHLIILPRDPSGESVMRMSFYRLTSLRQPDLQDISLRQTGIHISLLSV